MKRQPITEKTKAAVFERDHYTCQYCGRRMPSDQLEVDHLQPLGMGGTSDPDNLVTACADCNRRKGNKTLDEFFAEKEYETRAKRTWAWLSLAVAFVGLVVSLIAGLTSGILPKKRSSPPDPQVLQMVDDLRARTVAHDQQLASIIADMKVAIASNNISSVAVLDQRMTQTDQRLSALESAISADPAKALSIPLLRKDVDSLAKSVESDIAMVKREVDRIYDLSKWFIGLMVTMLLTVMGMAVSTLVSTKKNAP